MKLSTIVSILLAVMLVIILLLANELRDYPYTFQDLQEVCQ